MAWGFNHTTLTIRRFHICSNFHNSSIKITSIYLHIIYRFHEPRCSHEERWIGHSSCCRNDLARSTMEWLRGNPCINNLKLDISNGLITQRSLPCTPLKSVKQMTWNLIINEQLIQLKSVKDITKKLHNQCATNQLMKRSTSLYYAYPWTMESFTALSRLLSTSVGRVSSNRMLGPWKMLTHVITKL